MNTKFVPTAFLLLLVSLGGGTTAFGQKLTTFVRRDRLGYKNARGRIVIPARFILAGDFTKEGLAIVVDDEGWALIDKKGRVVIRTPFLFDGGPDDFTENLARFTIDENSVSTIKPAKQSSSRTGISRDLFIRVWRRFVSDAEKPLSTAKDIMAAAAARGDT